MAFFFLEPAPREMPSTPLAIAPPRHLVARRTALIAVLAICAVAVYLVGASEHARRMNTIKRRGDQSSYVQYAKDIYGNWTGRRPAVAGDRNRMPLYPAYQALFYAPALSDEEFFQRGKVTSIALSVALLGLVAGVSALALPPTGWVALTAVAAFTCFVFKAGYFQADLLYYTLHYAAFVAMCRALTRQRRAARWGWATGAGLTAALAYLAKAAVLPLVALAGTALIAGALAAQRGTRWRALGERSVAAALLAATFLLVLSPYLLTSKQRFGHYFYNVNSTFYMWYDDWGDAIKGTRAHGDREGWPRLPAEQLPGPMKYWREHSVGDIGARVAGGFRQMAIDLWAGFWVLKFVVATLLATGYVLWPARARVRTLLGEHAALAGFAMLYFAGYLTLAAFYAPISGTGVARFTLAMYLPLLYVAASLRWQPAFRDLGPPASRSRAARAEWFLLATLALDVPFSIWPRLLTTYAGF
jgi:hypothetical protein